MSRESSLPVTSSTPQQWSWKVPTFSVAQGSSFASTSSGSYVASTNSIVPAVAQPQPATKSVDAKWIERARKRRRLDPEEEGIKNRIAASISTSLEADHLQVLNPDVDTPFEDEIDIVNRLLPYHVFQQPKSDLDALLERNKNGRQRTTHLHNEIKDTKFALSCHNKFANIQKRLRVACISTGKHSSPLTQSLVLERLAVDSDRVEGSGLDQELSSARAELDRLLRAQRQTVSNATARPQPPPPASYYGFAGPTYSAPSANYGHFYNTYTYSYGQPGTPYTSNSVGPTPSYSSTIQAAGTSKASTGNVGQHTPSIGGQTTAMNASSTTPNLSPGANLSQDANNSQQSPPNVAIPLQIPVTSLPALQALGILPVPKAALPPSTEPQPPAVLVGSTNNGSMLSLEINAALLQAPQMSGLAILLSSLVKSTGVPANGKDSPNPSQPSSS